MSPLREQIRWRALAITLFLALASDAALAAADDADISVRIQRSGSRIIVDGNRGDCHRHLERDDGLRSYGELHLQHAVEPGHQPRRQHADGRAEGGSRARSLYVRVRQRETSRPDADSRNSFATHQWQSRVVG